MIRIAPIFLCCFIFSAQLLLAHDIRPSGIDYVQNKGQWEKQILFRADVSGATLFLENDRLTFLISDTEKLHPGRGTQNPPSPENNPEKDDHFTIRNHAYQMKWINSNTNVKLSGNEIQTHYVNYFIGNKPDLWKSNVPVFKNIVYSDLYPNIDFSIYSHGPYIKSDYIVKKGANPLEIQLYYEGHDQIRIDDQGNLQIITSVNTVTEQAPYAYQVINDRHIPITCRYHLNGRTVTFELPDGYDTNYELIIDPTLIFSTYSGSVVDNWGSSATNDSDGNMFVGGVALGHNYPTTMGAFQTFFGGGVGDSGSDIVITKFTSDGGSRLYSTYIGGNRNELLTSLFCTPENELVALITTGSINFPTSLNGFDRTFNGGQGISAIFNFPGGTDLAIVKLNPTGSNLIGSTYFGGTANDGLTRGSLLNYNYGDDSRGDLIVDNNGFIYIGSNTKSNDILRTAGRAQPTQSGGMDGLIAKFNNDLSNLEWASYFGQSGDEGIYNIKIDSRMNIIFCGGTTSTNIPGASQGLNSNYLGGTADGFVGKLNPQGSQILAMTYLGTSQYDQAFLMDLDKEDNVYIFGQTLGAYPVTSGVYSNPNSRQFIHKLNNDLNTTIFSTTFGTPNYDRVNICPTALMVDICDNIYASGWGGRVNIDHRPTAGTTHNMTVTSDAFQNTTDGSDFYLIKLGPDASSLIYATYFGEDGGGGEHLDGGISRFDKFGTIYQAVCASCGGSNGFPTTDGAYSRNNLSSNCNMAGFKFQFEMNGLLVESVEADPNFGCFPLSTTFSYTSNHPGVTFHWDFGDGNSSTEEFPNHTYAQPGVYKVKFIIRDPENCNPLDSMSLFVTVVDRVSFQVEEIICEGDTLEFYGQKFTESGDFPVELINPDGCDSLIFLNLYVEPLTRIDTTLYFCEGLNVEYDNQIYDQSGIHTFRKSAVQGCDTIFTLNIIEVTPPNPVIQGPQKICRGESITLNVSPPGHNILWSTGNINSFLQISQPGIYQVTVTDIHGCSGEASLELSYFPDAVAEAGDNLVIECHEDGVLLGINPWHLGDYEWSGPGISSGNKFTPQPYVDIGGTYILQFTSPDGCVAYDSIVVEKPPFILVPELRIKPVCIELIDGEIEIISISGGTPPYQIKLSNGEVRQGSAGLFANLEPDEYLLTLTDKNGCSWDTLLLVDNSPELKLELEPVVTIKLGTGFHIIPRIIDPGVGIDTFYWDPVRWLNCENCIDPISVPMDTIVYTLRIVDLNGCIVYDSIKIRVFRPANIYIPNAFTPNGDGINDVFMIYTDDAVKQILEFKIFDRWGELVHEKYNFQPNDPLFGWDGTFRGKDMNPAVFVYYVVAELEYDETVVLQGDITLFR